MAGKKLRSEPCRLTLEVSQEADHLGRMGNMTHDESVQSLQSVKLILSAVITVWAAWILFEIDGSMDGLGYD
jgi:hypothetical protein